MPYRHRVLGLLFLLVFIMYLDRLCIAVAGPRIQQEMGLTATQFRLLKSRSKQKLEQITAATMQNDQSEVPSSVLADPVRVHALPAEAPKLVLKAC